MNYFELHIGDYESATAHLSILEDGFYGRLLRVYYRLEEPLPCDVKQVCRLVRAVSKLERATVTDMLTEFFELRDDGWHNVRCDEEVLRYQDKQRKARASAEARWGAHRPQSDGNADAHANASPEPMRTHSEGNAPRARSTLQSPDTNPQYPEGKTREQGADGPAPITPTQAGSACLALRRAGITDGSTSHPKLLALLAQGVTNDELVAAAQAAVEAKKPKFAYVLGVVEGRRRDAAAMGTLPPAAGRVNRQQALEDSNRAVGQAWAANDSPGDDHAQR